MMGHPCFMGEYARLMIAARRRRFLARVAFLGGVFLAGAGSALLYWAGA